nr:MAG TPA: hypothetical protein [Caudoviricetes sp.]
MTTTELSAQINGLLRPMGITRNMSAYVQRLAGYPLTGTPSAVQFLEMLYNALVRM